MQSVFCISGTEKRVIWNEGFSVEIGGFLRSCKLCTKVSLKSRVCLFSLRRDGLK